MMIIAIAMTITIIITIIVVVLIPKSWDLTNLNVGGLRNLIPFRY